MMVSESIIEGTPLGTMIGSESIMWGRIGVVVGGVVAKAFGNQVGIDIPHIAGVTTGNSRRTPIVSVSVILHHPRNHHHPKTESMYLHTDIYRKRLLFLCSMEE